MMNIKKIVLGAVALVSSLALVACGSRTQQPNQITGLPTI